MSGWRAIFRHEWRSAWATPLAGTFIIIYCLSAMLFTFFIGDFFARGRADLQAFFIFQPWLLMILAPALAMRAWSEEFAQGTAESLLTLPVSTLAAVLGKYLAQFAISAIAIVSTSTLWITANNLGTPDQGVIFASYFACLLMAAVLLALANIISALCSSSVSAFGLSLVAGAILLALGAPLLQGFFSEFLPAPLAQALQNFGLSGASKMMFQGLVRFSDVLNLLLAAGAGLLITRILVDRKRHIAPKPWHIPAIICAAVALMVVSSTLLRTVRLDMTDGKSFTLTEQSRALVADLREPVHLKLMMSASGATNYPLLQNHIARVDDVLDRYTRAANGKVTIEKVAIDPDTEAQAQQAGIEAIETPQGEKIYFGLLASNSTNGIARVPFLAAGDANLLEYEISRAIRKVAQPRAPRLGIVSSLPLATGRGGAFAAMRGASSSMRVLQELQTDFEIKLLLPTSDDLAGLSAVLLLQPPPMSPQTQAALDAFARAGKPVLVMADPWPERWQDQPGALLSAGALAPLLSRWGIALQADHVVVDTQNALITRSETPAGTAQMQAYPLWLSIGPVQLLSSGALRSTRPETVALLRSSNTATHISIAEAMASPAPEALAQLPKGRGAQILALRQKNLIVIADADMLDDDIWDGSRATANFVLSAVDALLARPDLAAARDRPSAERPFLHLQEQQAKAQAAWGTKSAALSEKQQALEAQLSAAEQAGDSGAIEALRADLAETRKAQRAADRHVATSLRQIERRLTAANLTLMPLLFALLTAWLSLRRRARMRHTYG
jgi:ABC-2 type transport system permease protein